MAKAKKEEKAKVEIKSTNALIAIFGKLVDAMNRIAGAAQVRDDAKNAADDAYTEATAEDLALVKEIEDPALDYVDEHREELLPDGLKSGIIGPVTVEFRLGAETVRTQDGKEPKDMTILLNLQEVIKRARGEAKTQFEACIDYKPKLKKAELKKLPPELLKRLGLKIVQDETVAWKPNAER